MGASLGTALPYDTPPSLPPSASPVATPTRIGASRSAVKWSPTGEAIHCEFHWSFYGFVEFLEFVSGQEFGPEMGHQYKFGDCGEAIPTDEDGYRAFIGGIQKTSEGTRVFVRPTSSTRFPSLLRDDIMLTLPFT